jgi:hypothetical protein
MTHNPPDRPEAELLSKVGLVISLRRHVEDLKKRAARPGADQHAQERLRQAEQDVKEAIQKAWEAGRELADRLRGHKKLPVLHLIKAAMRELDPYKLQAIYDDLEDQIICVCDELSLAPAEKQTTDRPQASQGGVPSQPSQELVRAGSAAVEQTPSQNPFSLLIQEGEELATLLDGGDATPELTDDGNGRRVVTFSDPRPQSGFYQRFNAWWKQDRVDCARLQEKSIRAGLPGKAIAEVRGAGMERLMMMLWWRERVCEALPPSEREAWNAETWGQFPDMTATELKRMPRACVASGLKWLREYGRPGTAERPRIAQAPGTADDAHRIAAIPSVPGKLKKPPRPTANENRLHDEYKRRPDSTGRKEFAKSKDMSEQQLKHILQKVAAHRRFRQRR